jgi:hypothetical protein
VTSALLSETSTLFVHADEVIFLVVALLAAMWGSVAAYRAMQRPRLVLTEVAPGRWRASRRDTVQYLLSIPFLLFLWVQGLMLILLFTKNDLKGPELYAVATAIVIAVRILAHLSHEHSHELAKSVPLTIVTLLVITGSWRTGASFDQVSNDFLRTNVSLPVVALPLVVELAMTGLWYWVGVRWWWEKGYDVPALPENEERALHEHSLAEVVTLRHHTVRRATDPARR